MDNVTTEHRPALREIHHRSIKLAQDNPIVSGVVSPKLGGIARKLETEYRVIVKESPGVGLVLVERAERARAKMYGDVPSLRHRSFSYINDEDAYGSGKRAGSRFSTGRNGVNGQFQIGSGSM